MQTTVEQTYPRKLRTRLENAQDLPPEIIWEENERLVIPTAEIWYRGECYRPQRSEPVKKGQPKIIPAETFTAPIDDELKGLRKEGKIYVDRPWVDRGHAKDGTPAYLPWPGGDFESEDTFADTLVKVQMRRGIWRQVFAGLPGREIVSGSEFWTTWPVVRTLGFDVRGGALELL